MASLVCVFFMLSCVYRNVDDFTLTASSLSFFFFFFFGVVSGFIKFLGPYYMLVITERREIGDICGHRVYEVSKSEIISLQNSSVLCNIANSRDENRYLLFHYDFLCC